MSNPFSKSQASSQPLWGTVVTIPAVFSMFPPTATVIDEVGYGEGGFGEDGYDTPAINIQAAPRPNWSLEITK